MNDITPVTEEEQKANKKTFDTAAKKYLNRKMALKTFLAALGIGDEGALICGSGCHTMRTLMDTWEGTEREKRQGVVDLARNYLREWNKLPRTEEPDAATKAMASPSLEEQVRRLSDEVGKMRTRIETLEAAGSKKTRAKIPAQ